MRKLIKPLVFVVALVPLVLVLVKVLQNDLGPDPAQELAKITGEWSIRFLLIALALTPLRLLFNQVEFVRHRRMLGLFALFYATVHFLVWMTFLLEFRWGAIYEELLERPFITVGFSAYMILVVLGITSPKIMVRKLGRNWKRLHRLVYVASILAVIHLLWILRTDVGEAVLYGGLVALLLGYRALHKFRISNSMRA
ncbi:MAG: sulfoxide reductase heme-binding subunit YedZ [Gammaproteobacteria bacterium]|nr:sulfoxide reductase heme-binding subunit YedZ [Gammaproteobacteria bacterium]